jgi:hypothetical protein
MVAADVQRLEALWADPSRVAASDMPWLSGLVKANPAAVPLWWLYLRAVQKAESPQFTQVLHRCAALSPNRSALMAWVEEPLQPVASGEVVSSTQVSSEPVTSELVSADSLLVPGDSTVVLDQEPQETSNEEPQVASNEKPAAVEQPQETTSNKKPASAKKELPTRPEPKATNAATLNLDALPERVREQILRARAARAQLTGLGFGSAPSAPKVEPVAVVLPKVEPVQVVPEPVVPVQEPKPVAPAMRTSEPAAKKPKQQTAQASQVANEPTSPTLPASPTILSPFAQFVVNLEASNIAKGEELIDQFLSVNPRISKMAKDAPAPVVRTEPDAQVTGLVTETLARMYAEQGHIAKAIQAYEILKLRVPEKSSIFAARIEALKTK